jgi:UDP-glucose 6-dehydrogenase
MKISFINAVASMCESVGANVTQACHGIGADSRIGPRFLNPGIGYGGSCFPKDVMAFRAVARECGYDFGLLDEVSATDADALLILTEWDEFANLDLRRLNDELKYPIVIDGCNLYDPEVRAANGFTYYSVGRAASHPEGVPLPLRKDTKKP